MARVRLDDEDWEPAKVDEPTKAEAGPTDTGVGVKGIVASVAGLDAARFGDDFEDGVGDTGMLGRLGRRPAYEGESSSSGGMRFCPAHCALGCWNAAGSAMRGGSLFECECDGCALVLQA